MLLDACREEADLSLFGGAAIRWDTVRFLSNLLRLREEEKRAPAILDQAIERPLIIAGLPRSGTTFLHGLLDRRPGQFGAARLAADPSLSGEPLRRGRDRRPQQVARQLRLFQMLAPQFRRCTRSRRVRRRNARRSPRTCSPACASTRPIASRATGDGSTIPGISTPTAFTSASCSTCSIRPAASGRWVLKCPDHIFALRRDPRGLSRCATGLRASRPGRGAGLGRAVDRGAQAAVHPPDRPDRHRPARTASAGWRRPG